MSKLAVLVSGNGSNLQAIIDAIESGELPGVEIAVVLANRREAQAIRRAIKHGIPVVTIDALQQVQADHGTIMTIIWRKSSNSLKWIGSFWRDGCTFLRLHSCSTIPTASSTYTRHCRVLFPARMGLRKPLLLSKSRNRAYGRDAAFSTG